MFFHFNPIYCAFRTSQQGGLKNGNIPEKKITKKIWTNIINVIIVILSNALSAHILCVCVFGLLCALCMILCHTFRWVVNRFFFLVYGNSLVICSHSTYIHFRFVYFYQNSMQVGRNFNTGFSFDSFSTSLCTVYEGLMRVSCRTHNDDKSIE